MPPKKAARPSAPPLNLPIFLIALFGVLVVVHLWVQQQAGFVFGCTGVGDAGSGASCAAVTSSQYSVFLGLDVLIWGGLFYLAVAALRFGVAMSKPPTSDTLRKASFAATGAGMLFVVYLVSLQAFVIEQFCLMCLVSSATATMLFVLHVVEWRRMGAPEPKERAVARAVSFRPYAIGVAALALLVVVDVAIFSDRSEAANFAAFENEDGTMQPTSAQLQQACQYDPAMTNFRLFDMFTTGQSAYDGSDSAPAKALKFFDPNCPHCATLHMAMKGVVPEMRDDVRIYYQPIALWDHSIPQVQAMYIAREQGNEPFLAMMKLQLENQRGGGLPVETLVEFAGQIGLDAEEFEAELLRGKYVSLIRSEQQMAAGAGVNSVPKLIFERRAIVNSQATWTPECLQYFAESAARG